MSPEKQNLGKQYAESRPSRLGGAIAPPQKFLNQPTRLGGRIVGPKKFDLGDFASRFTTEERKTVEAKMDVVIAASDSRRISREAEKAARKEADAKVANLHKEEKKPSDEHKEIRPAKKEEPLTDLGFIEVDYGEKIDLETDRFRRPFIIDFISLRKEETRRKLEEQKKAEDELRSEVEQNPIEISNEDKTEAEVVEKKIHEQVASESKKKEEDSEAAEKKRKIVRGFKIFGAIAVFIVLLGGLGFSVFIRKNEGDPDLAKINKVIISAFKPDGKTSLGGKITVTEGENVRESQFNYLVDSSHSELRVLREDDIEFVLADKNDNNYYLKINQDQSVERKLSEAHILDSAGTGKQFNEFVDNSRNTITTSWIKLSNNDVERATSRADEKYKAEADCLRFLSFDVRDMIADYYLDVKIDESKIEKNGNRLNFKLSAEEWSDWLRKIDFGRYADALITCWDGYAANFELETKQFSNVLQSESIVFEKEGRKVEITGNYDDKYVSDFNGNSRDYQDVITDLRTNLYNASQPIALEEARRKCNSNSSCVKGFSDILKKRADSMDEEYFFELFGFKTNGGVATQE